MFFEQDRKFFQFLPLTTPTFFFLRFAAHPPVQQKETQRKASSSIRKCEVVAYSARWDCSLKAQKSWQVSNCQHLLDRYPQVGRGCVISPVAREKHLSKRRKEPYWFLDWSQHAISKLLLYDILLEPECVGYLRLPIVQQSMIDTNKIIVASINTCRFIQSTPVCVDVVTQSLKGSCTY